ncbi:MAG: c-type cytochrome [Gammaproteobacteria bacterium]|nr:c-type cytochrome [Gammaproteobacteria bacterium]
MMRRLLIALSTALQLAACSPEQGDERPTIDLEAGRQFVQEHCDGCHTIDGGGRTSEIPNLAGQPAEYLLDAMRAYHTGQRRHAALQDLIEECTVDDMRNISAYFASLPRVAPQPEDALTASAYREGEKASEACADCHGEKGFSSTPGVPNLAGQHPMYLIVATQEYASGSRDNAEKQAMLEGLDNVDIEKMAMYFAAQAPVQRDRPSFGDPVMGEALAAMCGSCHGARGISEDPLVPNLAGQESNYLVGAIRAYRDEQRSHEEMVADKSDAEIESIAAFYSVQRAGPVTENGEQTAEIIAKCERCHGPSAGVSTMVVPSLRGQKRDYLLRVMQEYRDGERGNSMMHKMSAGYSDPVLAEIAEYYATLAE